MIISHKILAIFSILASIFLTLTPSKVLGDDDSLFQANKLQIRPPKELNKKTPPNHVSFCDDFSPDDPRLFESLIDDHFLSPSLNRSVWNVIQDDDPFLYNDECGINALCDASNVQLLDNHLSLTLRHETKQSPLNHTHIYEYTTAGLHTMDKIVVRPNNQTVSRFCIRALIPKPVDYDESNKMDSIDSIDSIDNIMPMFWLGANNVRRFKEPFPPNKPGEQNERTNKQSVSFNKNHINNDPEPDNFYICRPDSGEVMISHSTASNLTKMSYQWQTDTEKLLCQYPSSNSRREIVQQVDFNEYHEWGIERGVDYVKYFIDNEFIGMFSVEDSVNDQENRIYFNETAPWMVSINMILLDIQAPSPNPKRQIQNNVTMYIDYIRLISHDGSENDNAKKQRKIVLLLLQIGGGFLVGFIFIYCICMCRRKRSEVPYSVDSEPLLLNRTEVDEFT
jgi:hypothetical protein